MLVLSRRSGQSIRIGDDVVVVVLEVSRDQVRIGIRAPRSLGVHREEVYEEILIANRAAASVLDVDGIEAGDAPAPTAAVIGQLAPRPR
jgi:carbon storage regulator